MMPSNDTDYKTLFSQLIKKQMLILGPDITLAKVKNVIGITVDVNGDVIKLDGDPQKLMQGLINQFVELSGMIVKKTMESILTSYPGMVGFAATTALGGTVQSAMPEAPSVQIATQEAPQQAETAQTSIPITDTPKVEVTSDPVAAPHVVEPPPMTSVSFDSLKPNIEPQKKQEASPAEFTSKEMEDLNKALDDLSKVPLSTENQEKNNQINQ